MRRTALIISILTLLVSLTVFSAIMENDLGRNSSIIPSGSVNNIIKLAPPIYITDNTGFSAYPGSGNTTHPYIIEDLVISVSGTHCIWIQNTTAHFIIRNCTLSTPLWYRSGIYLQNVTNGLLENNTITDTGEAISAEYSTNLTICYNNLSENYKDIYLRYSQTNILYNNTSFDTLEGSIWLYKTNSTEIFNNTLILCNLGISLDYSMNDTVCENKISQTTYHGVDIFHSFNNTFSNNTINDGEYGFMLNGAENNTICNNTIVNNIWTGISVRFSSDKNYISQNTIQQNKIGINNWNSHENWYVGNIISNGSWEGIRCGDHSLSNHFLNNYISNYNLGIQLYEFSNNNFVIENFISSCNRCIAEFQCWDNTIRDNTCENIVGEYIPGFEGFILILSLALILILYRKSKKKVLKLEVFF